MSKTPLFDKALDEYFARLGLDEKGGQWRTCRFSSEKFYVRPEDVEFYKRIRVPLPTLSLKERTRRKLSFYNTYNLFHVTSAYSGEKIISQYPPSTLFKIYEHQVWNSDVWDPFSYGRPVDPARSFFIQYRDFQRSVPRFNLFLDTASVNSDYTHDSIALKNCYLVFDSYKVEDSAYAVAMESRNCFDVFAVHYSDTCYECLEGWYLYKCFFVEFSKHCRESWFLYDCRNCEYCFGCTNLRHKKYYFFNEPLTKEEYEGRFRSLNLGDRKVLQEIQHRFEELKKCSILRENRNERSPGSVGEFLINCKNCYGSFYTRESENVAYTLGGVNLKDSYDIVGSLRNELCYDANPGENSYGVKFSHWAVNSRNVEYSEFIQNCHDCFGCIGLGNKSFCVFNTQYREDAYWKLIDEVKMQMLTCGEYGEFFPPELAPFPYNISIGPSYRGFDDVETAEKYGYMIERIDSAEKDQQENVINSIDVPGDISDVGDDILDKVVFDRKHQKSFRYIRPELEFHRKFKLPLPLYHPIERLAEKRKRFGPIVFKLYRRFCAKCGKEIETTYAPDRPEKNIYCEACYLKEVL